MKKSSTVENIEIEGIYFSFKTVLFKSDFCCGPRFLNLSQCQIKLFFLILFQATSFRRSTWLTNPVETRVKTGFHRRSLSLQEESIDMSRFASRHSKNTYFYSTKLTKDHSSEGETKSYISGLKVFFCLLKSLI
jgi:hypothetical protein